MKQVKLIKRGKMGLIAIICFLSVIGCGFLSVKSVPQKQIEDDLKRQPLKFKTANGTSEWDFNDKSLKPILCFAVNTDESKISASNAELSVTVASWENIKIKDIWFYSTLYGKMLMRYKKEGDKWVLENAEPQDFTMEQPKSSEDFEKFVQRATPLCAKSN